MFGFSPDQLKLYGLGVLAAILATLAGALASRVSTLTESLQSAKKESYANTTTTAETLNWARQLKVQLDAKASSYTRLLAVRDKNGNPIFDQKGNPIFETFTGTESESSQMTEQLDGLKHQVSALSETVYSKDVEITKLRKQTSGPGFKFFSAGLSWDFPWDGLADSSRGRAGIEAGPNFMLGPLVLRSKLGVVMPPFRDDFDFKNSEGRLALGIDL